METSGITNEAVQAAADAIEGRMFGPIKLGELARAALEAGAPHMLAEALALADEVEASGTVRGYVIATRLRQSLGVKAFSRPNPGIPFIAKALENMGFPSDEALRAAESMADEPRRKLEQAKREAYDRGFEAGCDWMNNDLSTVAGRAARRTLAILFISSPLIIGAAYILTTDHPLRGWVAVMTACAVLGVWATAMIYRPKLRKGPHGEEG